MGAKTFVGLSFFCVLILAGCDRSAKVDSAQDSKAKRKGLINACELIQKDEIERVVGSPIKEAQSSVHPDRGFITSDCLYTAAEFSKSVSFSVTQKIPESADAPSPKDFWEKTFDRYDGKNEEREAEEHASEEKKTGESEEEESAPPKKIDGIGDEAFSLRSGLYVLKGDTFIRLSVGGGDSEEKKIEKSKALAAIALKRL